MKHTFIKIVKILFYILYPITFYKLFFTDIIPVNLVIIELILGNLYLYLLNSLKSDIIAQQEKNLETCQILALVQDIANGFLIINQKNQENLKMSENNKVSYSSDKQVSDTVPVSYSDTVPVPYVG